MFLLFILWLNSSEMEFSIELTLLVCKLYFSCISKLLLMLSFGGASGRDAAGLGGDDEVYEARGLFRGILCLAFAVSWIAFFRKSGYAGASSWRLCLRFPCGWHGSLTSERCGGNGDGCLKRKWGEPSFKGFSFGWLSFSAAIAGNFKSLGFPKSCTDLDCIPLLLNLADSR